MATPGISAAAGDLVGDGINAGPDGPLTGKTEDEKALFWASQGVQISGAGTTFQSQLAPYIDKGTLKPGYTDAVAKVLADNADTVSRLNDEAAAFSASKAANAAAAQAQSDTANLLASWRDYVATMQRLTPSTAATLDPDTVPGWFQLQLGMPATRIATVPLSPGVIDPNSINARDAAAAPVSSGFVNPLGPGAINAATVNIAPARAGSAVVSGDDVVTPDDSTSGIPRVALFVGAAGLGVLLLRAISSNKR